MYIIIACEWPVVVISGPWSRRPGLPGEGGVDNCAAIAPSLCLTTSVTLLLLDYALKLYRGHKIYMLL